MEVKRIQTEEGWQGPEAVAAHVQARQGRREGGRAGEQCSAGLRRRTAFRP